MRSLVLLVGLLAAGKVGYQDYVERNALSEVLLNTYRQDATEACAREADHRNFSVTYSAWSAPNEISISLGRSSDSEPYWQIGESLLGPAERDPYVVIEARAEPYRIVCNYDIVRQQAAISRI